MIPKPDSSRAQIGLGVCQDLAARNRPAFGTRAWRRDESGCLWKADAHLEPKPKPFIDIEERRS